MRAKTWVKHEFVKTMPPLQLDSLDLKQFVTITADGHVAVYRTAVYHGDDDALLVKTDDLPALVESLQRIVGAAREHFGPQWGNR